METVEGFSRDSKTLLESYEQERIISASPYTVRTADDILLVDTTGGAITINLPRASNGRRLTVLRTTGANNVTVTPNGSETIDGAASATISSSYVPLCLKASKILGGWISA